MDKTKEGVQTAKRLPWWVREGRLVRFTAVSGIRNNWLRRLLMVALHPVILFGYALYLIVVTAWQMLGLLILLPLDFVSGLFTLTESMLVRWGEPYVGKPVFEPQDPAEAAYWNFDARRKGYAQWKGLPQSERDAFKAEYRAALPRTD